MFIGQFEHHLEEKGRLSVPKKFRSQLSEGAVLSEGLDGCLFLYPKAAWEQLVDRLRSLPLTKSDARSFIRSLSFKATEAELDAQGRILIPDYLKKAANMDGSECVVAGAVDRIEIWNKSEYDRYTAQLSSRKEEIAEKLSDAVI